MDGFTSALSPAELSLIAYVTVLIANNLMRFNHTRMHWENLIGCYGQYRLLEILLLSNVY